MVQTRVDTQQLRQAVGQASDLLRQLEALLAPHLVVLTDKERLTMPKPRDGFADAGRSMARVMASFPQIAQVSGCDPAAVTEDLDNVAVITEVTERMELLSRRLTDSRLTWMAEAWVPSLTAYGVAKVLARSDGRVRDIVDPLANVFASRRERKTTPSTPE